MSDSATNQDLQRRPLDTDRVPVLPPGVPYLMQTLNDDNLGFREVAQAGCIMPESGESESKQTQQEGSTGDFTQGLVVSQSLPQVG